MISASPVLLYFSKGAVIKKSYGAAKLQEFYVRHFGKPGTLGVILKNPYAKTAMDIKNNDIFQKVVVHNTKEIGGKQRNPLCIHIVIL